MCRRAQPPRGPRGAASHRPLDSIPSPGQWNIWAEIKPRPDWLLENSPPLRDEDARLWPPEGISRMDRRSGRLLERKKEETHTRDREKKEKSRRSKEVWASLHRTRPVFRTQHPCTSRIISTTRDLSRYSSWTKFIPGYSGRQKNRVTTIKLISRTHFFFNYLKLSLSFFSSFRIRFFVLCQCQELHPNYDDLIAIFRMIRHTGE